MNTSSADTLTYFTFDTTLFGANVGDLFHTNQSSSREQWNATSLTDLTKADICVFYRFLMRSVTIGILCIGGLIGNILSLIVFSLDKVKTSTSLLFQWLAVVDSVLLVLAFPLYSLRASVEWSGWPSWVLSAEPYIVMYVHPCAFIAQTATIWLTVAVGVNRYIAVCKPYQAPRLCSVSQAYRQIFAVIFLSVLYNVPRFLHYRWVWKTEEDNSTSLSLNSTDLPNNQLYRILYLNVCYTIFLLTIPILVLTWLNILLVRTLKELKKRRAKMQNKQQQQDNNVTLVLIIVVLVFVLCQAPALLNQILWNALPDIYRGCGRFHYHFSDFTNFMVILNSAINFVIYVTFNTRFQQILLDKVCRRDVKYRYRECNADSSATVCLEQTQQSRVQ